jgi:hypothetical protein
MTAIQIDEVLALLDRAKELAEGEPLKPMPEEKQRDLKAVEAGLMSPKEFNNKWVPGPEITGDPVALLMWNEGISFAEAKARIGGDVEQVHAI